MNFITFSASTTNIFPASNTVSGGQLVTEWNLRSREMVSTDPSIIYEVGPSYVHGEKDFEVDLNRDGGGSPTDNFTLSIAEGRAVINGHYVENLSPMVIDLAEANNKLASQSRPILKGKLAIGIKTFYATEQTVAGSILVEDNKDMFLGVQLVVLPQDEMITPSESPLDKSKVTADIRLATFNFFNNVITDIVNLPEKLQYITPERIENIDEIVSDKYVTKTGLNSKKIYAFAGKGADPSKGRDTWEDVTDSLMVWDLQPERTTVKPSIKQAGFVASLDKDKGVDGVYLLLPHKQVEGMTTVNGDGDTIPEYYAPRTFQIPSADYSTATPGVVTNDYTHHIQDIAARVRDLRNSRNGKQVMYMDTRTVTTSLPKINDEWDIGDYILVKNDDYSMGSSSSTESSPATMYVILPGEVLTIEFITKLHGNADLDPGTPDNVVGAELGYQTWYQAAGQSAPDTTHPEYYPTFYDTSYPPRGVPYNSSTNKWNDYFRIRYYLTNGEGEYANESYPFDDYFYGVYTSGPRSWSDAILLTGGISLATENVIGGFYNASENATDYGYVRLDETGHLRLTDYELLRSGTLAYQLSDELTLPTNITITEIQTYLNEYLNRRIAFPSGSTYSSTPNVIDVNITINASDTGGTLEISEIDSRFNTAVRLNILGDADSNVTINIRDCQRIMINPTIQGTPIINMFRCNLRYDAMVLQYIRTCERDEETYGSFKGFRDMSLWYEQIDETDPVLTVNDMTVGELDTHILVADINYWKELDDPIINDNYYFVALKSITFSGDLDIIGCEILVSNNSTDNIEEGDKVVVGSIELPQGSSLTYPIACLTKPLKVDGSFTSAYFTEDNWIVTDNSFTLLTGSYSETDTSLDMTGQIAFHSKTVIVPTSIQERHIEAWEPDTYHLFRGGCVS